MMTTKASVEIQKNEAHIKQLEAKNAELIKQKTDAYSQHNVTYNYEYARFLQKEIDKNNNKIYKLQEKNKQIQGFGISTSEIRVLLQESSLHFHTIKRDKNLGMTQYEKVGFSKILGPCKISYTAYSGFMSNVRGCASLANKKHLDDIACITVEDLQNYKKQETQILASGITQK